MNGNQINNQINSQQLFKGVWPALLTPTSTDGTVLFDELEKLVELLITQGMDGLYILGSTGQGVLLREEQRRRITEAALSINKGRIPIIAQVGAMTTSESVRLAKHAAGCGAAGISSMPPIHYGQFDAAMAVIHYRAIAEASDLPFFPYQHGGASYTANISEYFDAFLAIPNIAGLKLTTSNLLQISALSTKSNGKLALFSGADELMCHAAMCGTVGAIGTMYNLWGPECQSVRRAFVNGNVSLGTNFMMVFQEVIMKILPNLWSFIKQAMWLRYRIDIGTVLPPLGNTNEPWQEHEVEKLVNLVIQAAHVKVEA